MPNKNLLIIAVSLCFLVAFERIYTGYMELIPAVNEGECAVITYNPNELIVKVLENRFSDATAGTVIMDENGTKIGPMVFNFRDLRNLVKDKIKCPKS